MSSEQSEDISPRLKYLPGHPNFGKYQSAEQSGSSFESPAPIWEHSQAILRQWNMSVDSKVVCTHYDGKVKVLISSEAVSSIPKSESKNQINCKSFFFEAQEFVDFSKHIDSLIEKASDSSTVH